MLFQYVPHVISYLSDCQCGLQGIAMIEQPSVADHTW